MDWYYHAPGEGRVGPLSADELRNRYRDRRIQRDTLVWREGLPEWQPLDRVADELDLLAVTPDPARPPPLPPGPPPGLAAASRSTYASAPARRMPPPERKRMSGCLIAVLVCAALAVPTIGILAAIALPAYQDYTVRAKLRPAVDLRAEAVQQQVEQARSRLGRCPNDAAEAGVDDAANVDFGNVDGRCAFRLTVRGVAPQVDGKTVVFAAPASDGGAWDCSGGDLPNRYRRPACKAADGPETP